MKKMFTVIAIALIATQSAFAGSLTANIIIAQLNSRKAELRGMDINGIQEARRATIEDLLTATQDLSNAEKSQLIDKVITICDEALQSRREHINYLDKHNDSRPINYGGVKAL